MNKGGGAVERMKIGLVVGLFAVLTGCAGFWGGGYGYGGAVVVEDPDMYLFGGDYYGEYDARYYSHRGFESRGPAHHGGRQSHTAARSGSGARGRR